MGRMGAEAMAESVREGYGGLRTALHWHLTSNHYPPHPSFMVEPALVAIDAANEGEWDRIIDLPKVSLTEHLRVRHGQNRVTDNAEHFHGWLHRHQLGRDHELDEVEYLVEWRDGRTAIEASLIIESFHLESFIEQEEY